MRACVPSAKYFAPLITAMGLLIAPGAHAHIEGVISFDGKPPARAGLDMSSDPVCQRLNPQSKSQALRVTDGKVADVFAYLVAPPKRAHPVRAKAQVFIEGCQLSPRVFGMQVGQKLLVENRDQTLHSLRVDSAPGFRAKRLPRPGATITHRFTQPKVMHTLRCDVHSWETAYVAVLDHPYFAVSDSQGRLRIPVEGLPDGSYELRLWHEVLGTQTLPVKVSKGSARFAASFRQS